MPIIHIDMYAGRSHEQKAELVKAFTEDMVRILKVPPDAVTVVFTDVDKANWAKAGVLVSDKDK